MYKLENLKREESLPEYADKKFDYSNTIIVTENSNDYSSGFKTMHYYEYLAKLRSEELEGKEIFIDDLKELIGLMGITEAVVQKRFVLR